MKRDITAMDDYVKSRPVPEKIWNKFLLTTNLVSFWNYVLPVLTLPVFIYLLPASEAVASFFLFLGFSFINGIYITCYRKATEWILKWSLILGWMGMFGFSLCTEYWMLLIFAVPYGLGAGAIDAAMNHYVASYYSGAVMNFLHCFYGHGSLRPIFGGFTIVVDFFCSR